jgi:hypothetical protein
VRPVACRASKRLSAEAGCTAAQARTGRRDGDRHRSRQRHRGTINGGTVEVQSGGSSCRGLRLRMGSGAAIAAVVHDGVDRSLNESRRQYGIPGREAETIRNGSGHFSQRRRRHRHALGRVEWPIVLHVGWGWRLEIG